MNLRLSIRIVFLLGLLGSPARPLWAEDMDAVRALQIMGDNPASVRRTLVVDWKLPIETPGQAQKIVLWTMSHLFGGFEAKVRHQCGSLIQAAHYAEAQGEVQTWALLTIFLASYQLCDVNAEKTYESIITMAKAKHLPELAVFAGAELGFMLAEQGSEQGFKMLDAATQMSREHTVDPTVAIMLRGYSAAILGLQGQHDKAVALQEELLRRPDLQSRRYQHSALHFNIAMELLNHGAGGEKKAKAHFESALAIAKALGEQYTQALNETALSSLAFREGRLDEAISLAQSAFLVFDSVQNARWQGISLFRLTQALIAKQKYAEAKQYLDKAQLLFAPDDKRARMRLEEYYSQIHEGMGQLREALAHQKKHFKAYTSFRDQMAEEERAKQVASLELDISEAKNRELQKANELQAERLRSAQRQRQLLIALGAGFIMISLLLVYSVIQTRKASERKRKIRRILDHIDEGIVTIDAHLKIEAEYSHYLQLFLGDPRELTGLDALDVLLRKTRLSAEEQSMIRETLRVTLGEPSLAWELNEDKLPREVIYQGEPARYAAMHWVPIFERGEILQSVLLGIRDISAQRLLEAEVAHTRARSMDLQRELAEIIDAGVKPVVPLIHRARQCLGRLSSDLESDQSLGELHTIKGIARGLSLQVLSQGTHDLESAIRTGGDDVHAALAHYAEIIEGYEELLKMFHLDRIPVETERLHVLHDALHPILPGLVAQLESAGLALGSLTVDDQVGRWDPSILSVLSDMLLHAFTNSADHGYILPLKTGAVPRPAVFHLCARRDASGGIEVRLSDQGAGLNRERVEAIARQRNFEPTGEQEIWDVLLHQAVTTAEQVSHTSGRGVGLSAIQSMLKPYQGRLRLRPRALQQGAELILEFPAPSLQASA